MTDMTEIEGEQAEALKYFRPDLNEVFADFFKDWKFSLQGESIDSKAVFADIGFMPLIIHATQSFYHRNFNERLPKGLFESSEEDAEGSIFGVKSIIDMDVARPHQSILIYLTMAHCCCDMFGNDPCDVDLDALIEWSSREDLQQDGLPDLVVATRHEPD